MWYGALFFKAAELTQSSFTFQSLHSKHTTPPCRHQTETAARGRRNRLVRGLRTTEMNEGATTGAENATELTTTPADEDLLAAATGMGGTAMNETIILKSAQSDCIA